MQEIKGRVIAKNDYKSITFLKVRVYDELKKSFCILNCSVLAENRKGVFLGAAIKIRDYEVGLDKEGNEIIKILDIELESSKEVFPNQFKADSLDSNELKYRYSVLNMVTNEKYLKMLNTKYLIHEEIRSILKSNNFLEVSIPVLESYYGGAAAKPFITNLGYNKKDYYLRTCHEFPLKALLVAGFSKIFYMGSSFRNEGLDSTHHPEFLSIEAYSIRDKLKDFVELTETIYRRAFYIAHNSYLSENFDLNDKWPIYEEAELEAMIQKYNYKDLDELMSSKKLGPFFHVKGYYSPLAKRKEERIQSYVNYDVELAHFYEEENRSQKLKENSKKDDTNQIAPWFVEKVEYGLNSCYGWGLGVDRLVSSVYKTKSIRDTLEFPFY